MAGSQHPVQCCEMSQGFPEILESANLMQATLFVSTAPVIITRVFSPEVRLYSRYIKHLRSNLPVNTTHLRYKEKSINVLGNNRSFWRKTKETDKSVHSVGHTGLLDVT